MWTRSWEEIAGQAQTLHESVRQHAARPEMEYRTPDAAVLAMLWRALRLYDGVLTLLNAELPEESAFLARSLFETGLQLMQVSEEASVRDALTLGWMNRSIDEKAGLLRVMKQLGLDEDIDKELAELESERQRLQSYRQRHNVGSLKPFRAVRDAALRYGRREDYWLYEWTHEAVHGTDAAWLFARTKSPSDVVGFHAKTDNPFFRSTVAGFAATSITDATVATFSIFGWQLPDDFVEPAKTIRKLLETTAG